MVDVSIPGWSIGIEDVATHDFNSDGNIDLVLANSRTNQFAVVLGRGDGTFDDPYFLEGGLAHGNGAKRIYLEDVNNDGIQDIVGVAETAGISFWLGRADGTFGDANLVADFTDRNIPSADRLTIGDYNNDGLVDFAIIDPTDGLFIWQGEPV